MKLAMLANPQAKRSVYKQFVFKLFREFPRLAFVAVDNGKIIGYVMGSLHDEEGEIEDAAVLDEYRQRGLGRKLVETELSAMNSSDAKHVILWVSWRNSASVPFYYKMGFRLLRSERDRVAPDENVDVIYLEKEL